MVHVMVLRSGADFAAVLWSVVVVPPFGVNVNVKLNEIGMNTAVLPMM